MYIYIYIYYIYIYIYIYVKGCKQIFISFQNIYNFLIFFDSTKLKIVWKEKQNF